MCGIFGYIGRGKALRETLAGLKKLEYRGYDSAGIAYIDGNNELKLNKQIGKVFDLANSLDLNIESDLALSHTRWATHGAPNKKNCHPHCSGDFVIVHNGIIENYKQLKSELVKENRKTKFYSDTDTEVVAKLLDYYFENGNQKETEIKILEAIQKTANRLTGAWAVAFINTKMPHKIYAFKKNSPLTVAGNGACSYLSSDLNAVRFESKDRSYYEKQNEKYFVMQDENIAVISAKNITFYDSNLNVISLKEIKTKKIEESQTLEFEHYMLKEIFETPKAVIRTYDDFRNRMKIKFLRDLLNFENITIIGCGTAYHAGLYGKYIFEKNLGKKVAVELSSEFRYKTPMFGKNDLVLAISQSGETADTIAGIKLAKEFGATTAVITNVQLSTITSICDYVFLTCAGPEIGVAATKSYVTQLYVLYLIAQFAKGKIDEESVIDFAEKLEETIQKYKEKTNYEKYLESKRFFFIGRSVDSFTASEGSLKLKEIAYLHSEGYPSGELKHGTLSLVDEDSLIIAIITQEALKEKTLNAVHETVARGAKVLIVSQFEELKSEGESILLPAVCDELMPLISILPLQLLAYHISVMKGLDPDKPRNLAKSVTVE